MDNLQPRIPKTGENVNKQGFIERLDLMHKYGFYEMPHDPVLQAVFWREEVTYT